VRLSGTAAAPVVEAQVVINPSGVFEHWGIFSPDGGTTLHVCGSHGNGNTTISNGAAISVDGGANWTNKASNLPTANGWDYNYALAGWQDDPEPISAYRGGGSGDGYNKYNNATGNWDRAKLLTDSDFAWGIFAKEGTDLAYATRGRNDELYYSTDRGATWVKDTTYNITTQDPRHVVEFDGIVYTVNYSNACKCVYGPIGGPWTEQALPGTIDGTFEGHQLTVDDTGALWVILLNAPTVGTNSIYRRDPGTGAWSQSLDMGSGVPGGIWAVDSQNVLASNAAKLHFWDGSSWTTHTTANLGLVSQTFGGIWGIQTASIDSVVGPDGATARVCTKGGDILTASGKFPALATMQAYFGEAGDGSDTPCYFGQGYGYESGMSADGATVTVIAPPHPKSITAKLTLVVDGDTLVSPAIDVVERAWPGKMHQMRRNFAPWKALGPRRLDSEDLE
jgi:hypothetical protein